MTHWRLIDTGNGGAAYNMAVDEAIALCALRRKSAPALRLYGWSRPTVSLGRFQRAEDIDLEYCRAEGMDIVRRPTGGRAVLHMEELTYSISASFEYELFAGGLRQSYGFISDAFVHAFSALGIACTKEGTVSHQRTGGPSCFESASYGEISFEGRKIIGSAQRRWQWGMLQQGSIPLGIDYGISGKVFRGVDQSCMAGIREIKPGITLQLLKDAVAGGFESKFGIEFASNPPDEEESALARNLLETKYSDDEWNLIRHAPQKTT